MGRGEGDTAKSWLLAWRTAIRSLADNPLPEYIGLARRRAIRRVSPLRRAMLPLLILSAYTLLFVLLGLNSWSYSSDEELMTIIVVYSLGLGGLYWAVLICQGVFDAVGDCLTLLAQRSRSARHLCLDESLASSQLSDKDILAGALAVLAPVLLRRVLGGALLFAAIALTISSSGLSEFERSEFWGALLAAPFSILSMCLCGSLAVLALLLCFICFGLGQRAQLTNSSAAAIHAGAQFLYPFCALPPLFMTMEGSMGLGSGDPELGLMMRGLALIALLHLLFIWFVLHSSARSRAMRSFMAVALPFFLPLILACCLVFEESSSYSSSEFFAVHLIWAWGALAVGNPLASLGSLSFGGNYDLWGRSEMLVTAEMLRLGLLVLLQLAVLVLAALYAERAVRQWRQAGEGQS